MIATEIAGDGLAGVSTEFARLSKPDRREHNLHHENGDGE